MHGAEIRGATFTIFTTLWILRPAISEAFRSWLGARPSGRHEQEWSGSDIRAVQAATGKATSSWHHGSSGPCAHTFPLTSKIQVEPGLPGIGVHSRNALPGGPCCFLELPDSERRQGNCFKDPLQIAQWPERAELATCCQSCQRQLKRASADSRHTGCKFGIGRSPKAWGDFHAGPSCVRARAFHHERSRVRYRLGGKQHAVAAHFWIGIYCPTPAFVEPLGAELARAVLGNFKPQDLAGECQDDRSAPDTKITKICEAKVWQSGLQGFGGENPEVKVSVLCQCQFFCSTTGGATQDASAAADGCDQPEKPGGAKAENLGLRSWNSIILL